MLLKVNTRPEKLKPSKDTTGSASQNFCSRALFSLEN